MLICQRLRQLLVMPADGAHAHVLPQACSAGLQHVLPHACGTDQQGNPRLVCRIIWRTEREAVSLADSVALTEDATLGIYSFSGERLGSVQHPALNCKKAITLAANSQGRRLAVLLGATLLMNAAGSWELLATYSIPGELR